VPEQFALHQRAGRAAQFTATNNPCRRRLRWWIARATSSLPVPVSPPISTVDEVAATRSPVPTPDPGRGCGDDVRVGRFQAHLLAQKPVLGQ